MASKTKTISIKEILKLALLANLSVSAKQAEVMQSQFQDTLKVVDELGELDTTTIAATPQVTNLKNIFRSDEIDISRQFSQKEALSNAPKSHQGYFLVPRIGTLE